MNHSSSKDVINAAISAAGLSQGYLTGVGFEFTPEEQGRFHVYGTVLDGFWQMINLTVFYDGPPHLQPFVRSRDERVTACLEARGLTVKRYAYMSPITKNRLAEIVANLAKIMRP